MHRFGDRHRLIEVLHPLGFEHFQERDKAVAHGDVQLVDDVRGICLGHGFEQCML